VKEKATSIRGGFFLLTIPAQGSHFIGMTASPLSLAFLTPSRLASFLRFSRLPSTVALSPCNLPAVNPAQFETV